MSEKTFEFLVQGSEVIPYTVTFSLNGNKITATCSCRAGIMGQLCKHRLSILSGDSTSIVSGNHAQVSLVSSYLVGTETETFMNSVKQLEQDKKSIDDKIKKLKKMIIQSLS